MKSLIALLLLVSFSTLANPNFICWNIQNQSFNVSDRYYDYTYEDKQPAGYGSYGYKNDDKNGFDEVEIVATQHSDSYYYGTQYQNKEETLYNDIKCMKQ